MKAADRSTAAFAVIIGDQELEEGMVTIRPLRAEFDADQSRVARADLVDHLTQLVGPR